MSEEYLLASQFFKDSGVAVPSCSWRRVVMVEVSREAMVEASVLAQLVTRRDIIASLLRVVVEISVDGGCVVCGLVL